MEFRVERGEKFALLAFSGLTIGIDDHTPNPADLGFSCWSLGKLPFPFDDWWRCQLGKVVTEGLDRCNLVLATKQRATSKETFGEESQTLIRRVQFLFQGLAVSAGVPTFELGRLIYGTTVEPNDANRPKNCGGSGRTILPNGRHEQTERRFGYFALGCVFFAPSGRAKRDISTRFAEPLSALKWH